MDRNREARRTSTISSSSNGLTRRRHRTSLRDSPEEDGVLEMQDSRLRDRGSSGKKERERDRDRDRDRDRERDRDRMNRNNSSSSKRRRGDNRSMSMREGGVGDESSEESVNDDEEDEEDDGHLRIMQQQQGQGQGQQGQGTGNIGQTPSLSASPLSNHNSSRRSFPLPAAVAATTTSTTTLNKVFSRPPWKDEMIGVSVPRKARSASTKRSHECWASSSTGGVHGGSVINNPSEQNFRQASTSPVRPSLGMSGSPVRPVSPSSSNASARKKLKPNGPKQRPPKSGPKTTTSSMATSSSAQDEIEMEIAEVLYGLMRQPQANSQSPQAQAAQSLKTETFESREENSNINNNKDAKSRISSPVSNSAASASGGVAIGVQSSSILAQNSSSSVTPVSAIAPKRKKPRPVKYDDDNQSMVVARNSPISSTTKSDIDQATKMEAVSPNSDQPRTENGVPMPDATAKSQSISDSVKPEMNSGTSDVKPVVEEMENRDAGSAKEEAASPKRESTSSVLQVEDERVDTSTGVPPKVNPPVADNEYLKEEKFHIDLMAPPPSRSSPERDGGDIDFTAVNPKPMTNDVKPEVKSLVKEDEQSGKTIKEEAVVNADDLEVKAMAVDVETQKTVVHKEKSMDLHLDLEKNDTAAAASASVANNKQNQNQYQNQPVMKQQQQQQLCLPEKTAQTTTTLPFPMSVAGWPGGLPPMGYMPPLPGVVSMDGSTVASAAIQQTQLIFNQPRPKRCATHCYIARNISYHQQLLRMNSFWPSAATPAPIYGAKPCNLNVLPPSTDLHGNTARGLSSMPDKGQNLAIFSGQPGKEKASPGPNGLDAAQRKQILPQQALPAGAPSGLVPSAAFFFPLSQQAAAAASIRPASLKSPNAGNAASNASSSASSSASAAAAAAATALSFNYPNIPGGETQYLAILQNNAYPFPMPAQVGAAPAYRGTHAQAMPFFNGAFYSSQMLHPSQQAPAPTQTQQQSHQNTSISSGSSSSHKQLQNQQLRPPHSNGGNGSLQGFPTVKSPPSQQQSQHVAHQTRQLDSDIGGEDSPSTADSRVSRANMHIYGQGFPMAIHPPNFALMAPVQMAGAKGGASNPNEKKQQMLSQQHGSKTGIESLPAQAFAMSFASINSSGPAPGLDMSSIAQNHAILQSLPPEASRHQMASAVAAQSLQQKKNYRPSDEAKIGANEALNEDDRKQLAGKTPVIAFSRPDFADAAVSGLPGSNVVDSSARSLNMGSAAPRASNSVIPGVVNNLNASASQQHLQRNQQQQQQQMIQLTKQQHYAASCAVRGKTPTSNGSVYADHLPSSSAHSKYPNPLASFPQNIVQSGSSQIPSPQWKNSSRTSTPQVPSPLTSTTSSTHKNLPQAQGRNPPPGQTQISFASNPKQSSAPPGQQLPNSNQSSSPPLVVGSPTNSSMSKSAGGSPRTTTSSSTSNKPAQASSLSSQQGKSSPTVASRKSPPVVGGNVPSILGSSHMTTSSSGGTKHQLPQQQQINKQALQQSQLFFTHPYVQVQPSHTTNSNSAASVASGYYLQRRPPDQLQKPPQPQGTLTTTSSAMLSLASASTCDPVKAVAASASNMKVAGVPPQGILHAAQFAVAQSSWSPHPVPNAVQVKTAEQKQPAGE